MELISETLFKSGTPIALSFIALSVALSHDCKSARSNLAPAYARSGFGTGPGSVIVNYVVGEDGGVGTSSLLAAVPEFESSRGVGGVGGRR